MKNTIFTPWLDLFYPKISTYAPLMGLFEKYLYQSIKIIFLTMIQWVKVNNRDAIHDFISKYRLLPPFFIKTSLSTPLPAGGQVIWWYIFDTHPIGKLWAKYV